MVENNYITEELKKQIKDEQKVSVDNINAVLKLIEEGGTVPFIARYRKEVTGGLDEDQIRAIYQAWDYGLKLAQRKEDVLRLIDEKGKLTKEIEQEVLASTKLSEIEDIYRPYKEKRKTRATEALKKGLEPLANWLLSFPMEGDLIEEASKYITVEPTEEQEKAGLIVKDAEEALQGARDIIAEIISDDAKFRKWIRRVFETRSNITSTVMDPTLDDKGVYEMYYNYTEPVSSLKEHRVLALNRGETEKILRVNIDEDVDRILTFLKRRVIGDNTKSIAVEQIELAITDGYSRLIKNSIEREVRAQLKEKAEDKAISVFASNLKSYLLTPPMKGKMVLGVDPAYRTGCKLAVVDTTGKVLEIDKMFPNQRKLNEVISEEDKKYVDSVKTVKRLIDKYNIEIIAIGNGTASRETESFIVGVLKEIEKDVQYIIVNEAGASIYSASKLAQEEFPEYAVEERSAASIARRLQDPLSELVKIDPKSIGVGQYQHDVSQTKLNDSLDFVVETAVNSVGVNINSASVPLLTRVAGLNSRSAANIVIYRDENGMFKNRDEISKIKGIGPKTLEQCIGFLRIPDGNEKLDMTSIHPESYPSAIKILKKLGFTKDDIGSDELMQKIKGLDRVKFHEEFNKIGEYTFNDILDSLEAPLRDPRDSFEKPILRSDVLKIEDLREGMELQGTVRNVVDFGAFIDCGVKEDGLVHLSKMSNNYIKHPLDLVSVGDIVKVWVMSVDFSKNRIELTMISPQEGK
ncbi:MAG TPA: RNA-binding transcriptional accessory protein [Acholeplasmataceae bacterium]|nr:RNA-binding transcriptional accessory protein [Acholeplasmataceae bacterium]